MSHSSQCHILSFVKAAHAVSVYFYNISIKSRVLQKMKLLYSQKFIWEKFILLGICKSISMQSLKILRFFELGKFPE